MSHCIVESRDFIPSYRWPIVFSGTLAECRAFLATDKPADDNTWHTDDGFRYTRNADTQERHICRAWWAQEVEA